MAINPSTSQVRRVVFWSGIATSSTSRSRNGGMTPIAAETMISETATASRRLYSLKRGKIRRKFALRTAGSDGRSGASEPEPKESKRRPGTT